MQHDDDEVDIVPHKPYESSWQGNAYFYGQAKV